jgi:uncharacterized protein YndB with AHSA1/START domain
MGARYAFVTEWRVAAPPEAVFDVIYRPLEWPRWWKGVEDVRELEAGNGLGVGALHRYTWKSALPYRLEFDMRVSAVERPARLEGVASGELEGTGAWTFTPEGGGTFVRYAWDIETTPPWMNRLAFALRPAFAWNHDYVMRSGAKGLARLLDADVEVIEERKPRRRLRAYLFAALGAAASVFIIRRRRARRSEVGAESAPAE